MGLLAKMWQVVSVIMVVFKKLLCSMPQAYKMQSSSFLTFVICEKITEHT